MKKKELIDHSIHVLEQIIEGNFEARIKGECGDAKIDHLLSLMNDVIDRSDAYIREASACTSHVASNKYWRKIMKPGMVGDYLNATNQVNYAVDTMSDKVGDFRSVLDDFERDLLKIIDTVSSASAQLLNYSKSMKGVAQQTSGSSTRVADTAQQTQHNVETVSAASEQLSASISEISKQVSQTTGSMSQTKSNAKQVVDTVSDLSELSDNIGSVVSLIRDISDQTNMLALNATIEAARAGTAGKGFAVVATEVKNLASETQSATDQIASQIKSIQLATHRTQDDVKSISNDIDFLAGANASVSAAVEQQSAATNEIARNILEVSDSTSMVMDNISEVSNGAQETEQASLKVSEAAEKLALQASMLQKDVNQFMTKARMVI